MRSFSAMDLPDNISHRFDHPVYARYWQHYRQAMDWQVKHRRAYRRAIEAFYMQPTFGPPPPAPSRYSDWHGEETARGRAPKSGSEGSDSEIECDVSHMEITEELRQYFAQTERHREELKKRQQMEEEQQSSYVLADHDLHRVGQSALAPAERPGERRRAEMKKLYGEDAPKIQGMETAMQLTFDRNCDRKRPKYWPVIPLKL